MPAWRTLFVTSSDTRRRTSSSRSSCTLPVSSSSACLASPGACGPTGNRRSSIVTGSPHGLRRLRELEAVVEQRDPEHAVHALGSRDDHHPAPLPPPPRIRAEDQPQAGRVEELEVAEIEHDEVRTLRLDALELTLDLLGSGDVELTR